MTTFTDSQVFKKDQSSIMDPCEIPTAEDFAEENTVIFANIDGEVRLYRRISGVISYEVMSALPK